MSNVQSPFECKGAFKHLEVGKEGLPPLFAADDWCCATKSGGKPSFLTSNFSKGTLRYWSSDFGHWTLDIGLVLKPTSDGGVSNDDRLRTFRAG